MYFIVEGKIGVGINTYTNLCDKFEIGQKYPKNTLICDFYLIHKNRSNFNYVALTDVRAFCITRTYLHEFLFEKYPEYIKFYKFESLRNYKIRVYAPMQHYRMRIKNQ